MADGPAERSLSKNREGGEDDGGRGVKETTCSLKKRNNTNKKTTDVTEL